MGFPGGIGGYYTYSASVNLSSGSDHWIAVVHDGNGAIQFIFDNSLIDTIQVDMSRAFAGLPAPLDVLTCAMDQSWDNRPLDGTSIGASRSVNQRNERMWQSALSLSQLATEAASSTPVITANLLSNVGLTGTSDLSDTVASHNFVTTNSLRTSAPTTNSGYVSFTKYGDSIRRFIPTLDLTKAFSLLWHVKVFNGSGPFNFDLRSIGTDSVFGPPYMWVGTNTDFSNDIYLYVQYPTYALDGSTAGELAAITLTDKGGTKRPYAGVVLNDPSTYHGGQKEARVINFKTISRALSDYRGQVDYPTYGATLVDSDRLFRGFLEDSSLQYLSNRPLLVETVSDADRRAGAPMRIEMAGYVSDYAPQSGFQFAVNGISWLQKKLARKTTAPEYWQSLMTRAKFAQLPAERIGQAAPIWYGRVSDEAVIAGGGSTPADLYPRNAIDPGWLEFGYNGWGSGTLPAGNVYVFLTTIVGGLESTVTAGSYSFLASGPSPAFHVRFKSSTVPDLYRVYISDDATFNPFSNPLAGSYARYVDFTPASVPEGTNPYGGTDTFRYKLIDSTSVGADYHALVSDGSGGVATSATGAVPTIYIGEMNYGGNTRSAFLVARGAVKNILGVFVGGVRQTNIGSAYEIEAPFHGDYTTVFGGTNYLDFDGVRYTVIWATGTIAAKAISGEAPITVNLEGVEGSGDCTGLLLTSPVDILYHFAKNFLACTVDVDNPTYWLSTFSVGSEEILDGIAEMTLLDEGSFAIARAILKDRFGGVDPECAGGIGIDGATESALDIIASLCRDGDFDCGFNRHGQFMVSVEPTSAPTTVKQFDQTVHILDKSFNVQTALTNFWNVIPFRHTQEYTGKTSGGWAMAGEIRDAASITNYEQERVSSVIDRRWQRANTATAIETIKYVARQQRLRWRHPLRVVVLSLPFLTSYDVELGDVIRLTHPEGLGASGWVDHDVRVRKIDTDLNKGIRTLECYDLAPIYAGLEDSVEATWNSLGLTTVAASTTQVVENFQGQIASGAYVLLERHTASSSSNLAFTSRNASGQSGATFQSDYDDYEIRFTGVAPASNAVDFKMQVSYDGGSTYRSTSGDYFYATVTASNSPATYTATNDGTFGSTSWHIAEAVHDGTTSFTSTPGVEGTMRLTRMAAAVQHRFVSDVVWSVNTPSGRFANRRTFGWMTGTTAINAVKFYFSSGNIASGEIRVYGIAK